jgi:hypothetical protein
MFLQFLLLTVDRIVRMAAVMLVTEEWRGGDRGIILVHAQAAGSSWATCCSQHNAKLLTEMSETRKCILTISLAKPS